MPYHTCAECGTHAAEAEGQSAALQEGQTGDGAVALATAEEDAAAGGDEDAAQAHESKHKLQRAKAKKGAPLSCSCLLLRPVKARSLSVYFC